MSVYLKIDNCYQCPYAKTRGFFDTTPFCKKAKQELPYIVENFPPLGRAPGYSARMPTGVIPSWCPLERAPGERDATS